MASGTSQNFNEWLRRLGLKRPDEPQLIHTVQPVQVVSDVSELVSPLLPPTASAGGQLGATAGAATTIELHSLAPGGSFAHVEHSHNGTHVDGMVVRDTAIAMANVVANNQSEHVPDFPTVSVQRVGTSVTNIVAAGTAAQRKPSNNATIWDVYVPPGRFLYVQNETQNELGTCYILWQDIMAGEKGI